MRSKKIILFRYIESYTFNIDIFFLIWQPCLSNHFKHFLTLIPLQNYSFCIFWGEKKLFIAVSDHQGQYAHAFCICASFYCISLKIELIREISGGERV